MASSDKRATYRRLAILIAVFVLAMILACAGKVAPSDPILQPPLVNIGINMDKFFDWIGLFPKDQIPPPWIVFPPTMVFWEKDTIDVHGWAVSREDRPWPDDPERLPEITLYEVNDPSQPQIVRELGRAKVGDDHKWKVETISLDEEKIHIYIAATVTVGKTTSGWSNSVIISRRKKPQAPTIDSPADGTTTVQPTTSVGGTGEPGKQIVLQSTKSVDSVGETLVGEDGKWSIEGVDLRKGDNVFTAKAVSDLGLESEPSKPIKIHRLAFRWPYESTSDGYISQWGGIGTHRPPMYAIDIKLGNSDVLVAAETGRLYYIDYTRNYTPAGNSIVLEHVTTDLRTGKQVTYYSHYNHVVAFSEEEKQKVGRVFKKGEPIGHADSTGVGVTGPHVHFEILRGEILFLDDPKNEPSYRGTAVRLNINPSFIPEGEPNDFDTGDGEELMDDDFPWDDYR